MCIYILIYIYIYILAAAAAAAAAAISEMYLRENIFEKKWSWKNDVIFGKHIYIYIYVF